MRTHYLASAAAIALALGMSAAGAQNVDQRGRTDPGKQADQAERSQQPESSAQQRGDQDKPQGTQNQQGMQAPPQQNAPVTSGQAQQGARAPAQGQNQQQGAQAPQLGRSQQDARGAPRQGGENEVDKSGRIALNDGEQERISGFLRQQRIKPASNINFSLSVGSTVPSSVRISRISGELADIFPNYRDFSFFVAQQQLVIVDPQSHGIVGFAPISGASTVGAAPRREETGTVGVAPPHEEAGTAPPAPAKKKAVRTGKKRVTVTEEKPKAMERETIRGSPAQTETEVTVGTSRRDIEELDEAPPPPDRRARPPERVEHDEGLPFPLSIPFSLFFGRPN